LSIYEYLSRLLPSINNPVIFEVGAYTGDDTIRIMSLCKDPIYYAFEPDPRNTVRYKTNQINNVSLVEKAVSNSNGKSKFFLSSGSAPGRANESPWSYSSSLCSPKQHLIDNPWCKFDQAIEVETIRLDDFCKSVGVDHIDSIWCDAQGAEDQVIEGLGDMLKLVNYVYTEFSDREEYEGQKNLSQLMRLMPNWEIVHKYTYDVFLRNTRYDL
jgi:FkbM family methyltransferase